MNLVIVESPTKAKTLSKFLGNEYKIEASFGHIRDLPKSKLGVDVDHNFELVYTQTTKQKERTKELKKLSKVADKVYLATDPDREGEAISWHVASLLDVSKKHHRIVFHEITNKAIHEALEHPRDIDMPLVDAQQARRVLDRLVGYKLSPLLWRKVRKGLSAGRVQSVAVRLIVEKEREITAFVPEEFWPIQVDLKSVDKSPDRLLTVNLVEKNDEKIKIINQADAEVVEKELTASKYNIGTIEEKPFKRTPPAPYTTSTLQQAAANRLGWSAKRTMQVAQSLYEEGFITYHRTDSTNIAMEAVVACKDYLVKNFGEKYALDQPRLYKTKSKVAQEAHEAIRPTDVNFQLSTGNSQLNRDVARLYEIIWKRFVATQMAEVTGVNVTVSVVGDSGHNKYGLQAKGETLTFDGWYKLDRESGSAAELEKILSKFTEGEKMDLLEIKKEQKFTQPPSRYNDASLIKALEEMGIGRPSTYAPTLTTIQDRQYVEKVEKRFVPTAIGIAVHDFLMVNFAEVMDYEFTAKLEDKLDEIANGDEKWQPVIKEFYDPFSKKLAGVSETAERVKIQTEMTGDKCPVCNEGDVVVRTGRFGKFLSCSRYPDCSYKANYQNKTGQKCPTCTEGDVIIRKTRTGRTFFGCSRYPDCKFASWNKPVIPVPGEPTSEVPIDKTPQA
jgi:DNA topoisomerase I